MKSKVGGAGKYVHRQVNIVVGSDYPSCEKKGRRCPPRFRASKNARGQAYDPKAGLGHRLAHFPSLRRQQHQLLEGIGGHRLSGSGSHSG